MEKVENTVGNPTSFSQNRWKTQWKKLKNHSSWDTLPITHQNGTPHFPRIFLNGPGKHDTMKGVSLVLANTEIGEIALHQLERCYIEERTLEEALIENQSLKNPSTRLTPNHNNIIKDFLNPQMTLKAIDSKYKLVDHSLKATVKNMSLRLGLFTLVKRIYNWYKTLS